MKRVGWSDYLKRYDRASDVGDEHRAGHIAEDAAWHTTNFPAKLSPDEAEREWDWLLDALRDPPRRAFAVEVIRRLSAGPRRLLAALCAEAAAETDPDDDKHYVFAAIRLFGLAATATELIRLLREGDDQQKIGAAQALHWAQPVDPNRIPPQGLLIEGEKSPPPDFVDPELQFTEIRHARQAALLEGLLKEPAQPVARALAYYLSFDPADHPEHTRRQIPRAVSFLGNHADPLIREWADAERLRVGR